MKYLTYILILLIFACSCNKRKRTCNDTLFERQVFSDSYMIDSLVEVDDTIDNEECFVFIEEMPVFKGGDDELLKYLKENTEYPQTAINDSIEGRVFIGFIIEKDGSVSNIEVLRGIRYDLNEESIRIIEMMPHWKPGKLEGKTVRVSCRIPFSFKLDSVQNKKELKESKNNEDSITIKIYPNPATEYVNIELSILQNDLEYQISDSKGQVVKKGRFYSTSERIDISGIESGLYVVNIISKTSGVIATEKMIKK